MKKTIKLLALTLAVLMTLSLIPLVSSATDESVWDKTSVSESLAGKGDSTKPYEIRSAEDFMRFREMVKDSSNDGSCYALYCDIDFAGVTFEPIDGSFTFYGNSHVISNFGVSKKSGYNTAFFGTVKNCHIIDLLLNFNTVSAPSIGAAGFAGYAESCEFNGCFAFGILVSGTANVGGFIGRSNNCDITNCGAYILAVSGSDQNIGGFAGVLDSASDVRYCASLSVLVGGNSTVGGFAGYASPIASIKYCYAIGTASSTTKDDPNLHGFVGKFSDTTVLEYLTYNSESPKDDNAEANVFKNGKKFTLEDFYLQNATGHWLIEDSYDGDNLFAGVPYYIGWASLFLPFRDIDVDSWYANSLHYCYKNEYVSGISYDVFSPSTKLKRNQFVQILAKVAKADLDKVKYEAKFTDVPEGKWYTKAVLWAVENNITTGIGNGLFGPDNYVSREQLVVFLCAYAKSKGVNTSDIVSLKSYSDEGKLASWAYDAFGWAVRNNIVSGTSLTTLSPKNIATRAQIVVIIKAFKLYMDAELKK